MVIIFDLDDTLYEELTFVKSGFEAVAQWGENELGLPKGDSIAILHKLLEQSGRGAIFNLWLNGRGSVKKAVNIYRHHKPSIELSSSAKKVLKRLEGHDLFVVTDGHKVVQSNKIKSLGVHNYIKKIYITNQYGVKYNKPSTYCFELIKKKMQCSWSEMVYVGDNPNKDFKGLNPLGVMTVRILKGPFAKQVVSEADDGQHKINDLLEILDLFGGEI